jgi:hypothetical protein
MLALHTGTALLLPLLLLTAAAEVLVTPYTHLLHCLAVENQNPAGVSRIFLQAPLLALRDLRLSHPSGLLLACLHCGLLLLCPWLLLQQVLSRRRRNSS